MAEPDRTTMLAWTYMPSYGSMDWQQLTEAVSEARVGDRTNPLPLDPASHIGHQMVPEINFNSLNRIVTAFVNAAKPPPAPDQTNAEVSDERTVSGETVMGMPVTAYMEETEFGGKFATHWSTIPEHRNPVRLFAEDDVRALLNRRSVTSQASEGEDDKRQKYADAIAKLHGRDLDLCFGMGEFADGVTDDQKRAAMLAFFFFSPKTPASPSKRVERLEAALLKWQSYDQVLRTIDGTMLLSGDMPTVDALYDECVALTAQALQGGRS